jgi:ankyrin repeat protein
LAKLFGQNKIVNLLAGGNKMKQKIKVGIVSIMFILLLPVISNAQDTPKAAQEKLPLPAGVKLIDKDATLKNAVISGNIAEVMKMINIGANVNAQDKNGITLLMDAADKDQADVCVILLNNGAVVDTQSKAGWTALFFAAAKNNVKSLNALLNKGANINIQDQKGCTALMYAVMQAQKKTVDALLDRGANINLRANSGITALTCAKDKEIIALLNQKGIKITMPGQNVKTGDKKTDKK